MIWAILGPALIAFWVLVIALFAWVDDRDDDIPDRPGDLTNADIHAWLDSA